MVEAGADTRHETVATEDLVTGALTYKRLLLGTRILGSKLMPLAAEGKPVGVMLPNANGAVVTIFGLMSAGRVPAMINFTAGATNILAACKAAQIKTIVTARGFIERGKLEPLVEKLSAEVSFVYLEDVRATVGFFDKLRGLFSYKKPLVRAQARRLGGDPVHLGLGRRAERRRAVSPQHADQRGAGRARIDFSRSDKVFNVLPVFHSFGLTVGTVLPIVSGVPIFLYPSPLHYRTVPELVYGINATIMFGTDTFLNGYARAANPYDFRSLRYMLAGAEPVRESTRTDLSGEIRPAHSRRLRRDRNGAGARAQHADVQQIRHRRPHAAGHGSAAGKGRGRGRGRPAVREGPERDARLSARRKSRRAGAAGRRLARHRRYRRRSTRRASSRSRAAPSVSPRSAARWCRSRRSRRSPAICGRISLSAVASVPDARKGERLILFTQKPGATRSDFIAFARSRHASELMIPADVVVMEKLPMLGTGKVDLVSIGKLAKEHAEKTMRKPAVIA